MEKCKPKFPFFLNKCIRKTGCFRNPFNFALFRVICNSGFPDDIDLNLSGIFKLGFDLLGKISCHKHHVIIGNLFGDNHDTYFTAGLNCERLVNSFKAVCNIF